MAVACEDGSLKTGIFHLTSSLYFVQESEVFP